MLSIFKDKKLIYVSALVSLFLQIISFVTTYQGASYYFKEIFILSPLLFATAIQSVVYFLENSIRHRIGFTKIMALVLAITCSSYFSYIGIYNSVNSPLNYYRQTYNSYKEELDASYTNLINNADSKANSILKNAASAISGSYTSLKIQKKELNVILKELDAVTDVYSSSMPAPDRNAFYDYEDYAAAYRSYINQASTGSSSEINQKTKSILNKYGYKNRLAVINKLSSINGKLKALKQSCKSLASDCGISKSGNVPACVEKINSKLANMVSSTKGSSASLTANIAKFIELANQYNLSDKTFNAKNIVSCMELHKNTKETLLREFDDIAASSPSECKNILLQELGRGLAELNKSCKLTDSKMVFNEEEYPLDDIYVIPILRLVQPDTSAIAFSCLLIAVLTDILSLLFAVMSCPPFKVLRLRYYNKVLGDENLFEENIASALSLSMNMHDNMVLPDSKELKEEQLRCLANFISLFEAVPNKLGKKYILYTNLDKLEDYQSLIAILCQLKLAKIMPAWKYNKYATAYNGNKNSETRSITENKSVVLLKINFLLWCNEHWTVPEVDEAVN